MKGAVTACILILAIAASLGWRNHRQLSSVRESHARLVAQAATLGIEPDVSAPFRSSRRERTDRETQVKLIAKEYTALTMAVAASGKDIQRVWKATQQQRLDLTERIASLDSGQLELLISTVQTDPGLDQASRQSIIEFPLRNLAERYPAAALSFLTESPDLVSGDRSGENLAGVALSCWAADDAIAALRWVRENAEKHPHLVTEETRQSLISGTALRDPKLAFDLIGELHLESPDQAVHRIIGRADIGESGLLLVAAMREYFATLPKEKAGPLTAAAFGSLGQLIGRETFGAATAWITSLDPTPEELAYLSAQLPYATRHSERNQWIEWLDHTLPSEKSEPVIRDMVRHWTASDYQAAGKWLAGTPDGAVKNTSIQVYAETMSRYEPEHAAEWALTLPPGKQRDETLKQIYQNWPKPDRTAMEAADAFAREHGLK